MRLPSNISDIATSIENLKVHYMFTFNSLYASVNNAFLLIFILKFMSVTGISMTELIHFADVVSSKFQHCHLPTYRCQALNWQ
jgi:hypothetical protein